MQQLLGNDITNLAFYEAYAEYSEQSRAYRIQHQVLLIFLEKFVFFLVRFFSCFRPVPRVDYYIVPPPVSVNPP